MTLAELIKKSVNEFPNKKFIVDKDLYSKKENTYKEIYEKALKIISYFDKKEIKKGDKIITYLPNSSDYVAIMWACALSGVIAVPIDFSSLPSFAEKINNIVKAKITFCSVFRNVTQKNKFYIEEIEEVYSTKTKIKNIQIKEQDIFEIAFTSGTTSEPKGVVLTQENIAENVKSSLKAIDFNVKNLSMLSLLPLSHLFEQNLGLFCPTVLGAKICYSQSRKSSDILETIQKEKINLMVTVPLFLDNLKRKIQTNEKISFIKKLAIQNKFSPLRRFIVGGSALSLELERFWTSIGFEVIQGYGLTESSPVISCNSHQFHREGSVGKVLEGVEVKIVDGEILARGKNIFKGYYQNQEETKKTIINNWLHTGDLGKTDKEGYLFITGRKKNVIISDSGLNIYPEDIEKELNKIKSIRESVVLGLNEGKELVGVVLLDKKIDKDTIKQQVNSKLPTSQQLSKIIIYPKEDFPRTLTKKVIRREVEKEITGKKENITLSVDSFENILIEVCKISAEKLKENTKIIDLGIDSIKRIELLTKIEEKFNVDIEESDINEKTTIKSLRELIKIAGKNKKKSEISFLNSRFFNPLRFILQEAAFGLSRTFVNLTVEGEENLQDKNCIFMANHASMLDSLIVYRSLPIQKRINTSTAAAKDFFFENKLIGILTQLAFNAFSFSRKENVRQSLKDLGSRLEDKFNVLIYPEGTRSLNGKLQEFKDGTGIIAREMNVKIIPVKIKGIYEILPKGKIIPKRGKVLVKFGKPLTFNKMQSPQEITKILHEKIASM